MMILDNSMLEKMEEYVEKHKEEIIGTLRKLVEIPSVRGEETADAPYGEASLEILKESIKLFDGKEYSGRLAKSRKYAVIECGNGDKTIGMFAHGDVVAATGEWIYGKPFELTELDGLLIGRGSEDDKAGIVQMLYASKMLKELGVPVKSRLMFFVGGNEEDGMGDLIDFTENEKMPDVSFVIDGEYPYYAAEKSRTCALLKNTGKFENISNIYGGKCFNIVLDELNVEYKNGKREVIYGKASHAAEPEKSENALVKFAKDADSNPDLSENDRKILKETYNILADYNGKGLGIASYDENFGALTAVNGVVKTVDGHLTVSLDMRHSLVPAETVIDTIKHNTEGVWEVEQTFHSDGCLVDEKTPLAAAVRRACGAVSEKLNKMGEITGGATYARFLKNSFSIGISVDHGDKKSILKKGHGNIHGPDEAVSVRGLLDAVKILAAIIIETDRVISE